MQIRHVFLRLTRVSERLVSPTVVLIVVLVALNAQAQQPFLSVWNSNVNLGKLTPGSVYTARFDVQAFNGPIFLDVYDSTFGSNSVTTISPTPPLTIQQNQIVHFVVTGVVPNISGVFTDTIFFDPFDTSLNNVEGRIYGESSTSPSPPETYWVGIIPGSGICPTSSSLITVHMDDEDGANDNSNDRAGWIGAITSDRNTTFRFCRVDGRQFYPLASTNTVTNHYAVLKLGNSCPNGSTEFYRRFNNEVTNNQNSKSTSSGDNSELTQIESTRDPPVTRLRFCLFNAGASTMSAFPVLGIEYGVFAAWDFTKAIQTGWVFTDDEDPFLSGSNGNEFGGDDDGQRIVTPTNSNGRNTTLHTAKVRCATPDCGYCGNTICSPYENAATCALDCGTCGDSVCGANEDRWNCSADCGVCGDSVCGANEEEFNCRADCPVCGDTICGPGEVGTCPFDCDSYCGDGYCRPDEDNLNCPMDC